MLTLLKMLKRCSAEYACILKTQPTEFLDGLGMDFEDKSKEGEMTLKLG